MKCPNCDLSLVEDLYNGAYGCDSGCEYIRFELQCPCGFSWATGDFGYMDDEEDEKWYRGAFVEDFIKDMKKKGKM